ncbi:MAG: TROVE domain-containing protein [Dehalococcoidia bacterium]|nr:TROVE domain-containing protein [Dehalococcoidia bacterium]
MTTPYAQHVNTKQTPQSEPIPGSQQVPNSAGGFAFAVDDWTRLDRFLVLGSEGGSYYASERKLTRENAACVERCLKADGARTVARIVEVSDKGRAPKNDPAILALAMCAKLGDDATRKVARAALPKVCRIGTHLLHFAEYVQTFGGWGRGTQDAVARWYNDKPVEDLTYQVIKYQSRDKWSHRDLLRLSKPRGAQDSRDALYHWITKGWPSIGDVPHPDPLLRPVWAFEQLKRATTAKEAATLIREYKLPRECVPTQLLTDPGVWDALLHSGIGLTALLRNLATMTRVGLLAPLASATAEVQRRLVDREAIKRARVHPIAVLAALLTYRQGRSVRGSGTWTPVMAIADALDAAFYLAFDAIEPTGKRTLLALDVSGSMSNGECAGVPGLTPRVGSAAMALVTAAVEPQHAFVAFTSGAPGEWVGGRSQYAGYNCALSELTISPRQRIDDVCQQTVRLPMGGTDCSLPMLWAQARKIPIDTFIVYTDSETWAGQIHPVQALRQYRQAMGIGAKLIVVGMVANEFSIADPSDGGMMDVVGFDTAAPAVMADFARA